jgi:ATP/maltotriose-dependent transcriptional regulator MalT
LIVQKQWAEGVAQVQQGLEVYIGGLTRTYHLTWLAIGYGGTGQVDEGLETIAEALRLVDKNDERFYEAELYRVKGELLLNDERGMQNDERNTKEEERETLPIHRSSFIVLKRPKPASSRLLPSPKSSKPNPSNCAPRSASLVSGSGKASNMQHT